MKSYLVFYFSKTLEWKKTCSKAIDEAYKLFMKLSEKTDDIFAKTLKLYLASILCFIVDLTFSKVQA